ncbi:MAG: bifunctional phosphopantothenoylcysteine decarboxylase/phosphopantothenate--cysteine ligase CoaBC [Alphaproteobacteria bacterium]|nr:bifunctional phosphopantothenoylcysteine decarboxylase/phosphopantothenate--cysteine ligase CoaBC [Alphaproteobacteria bacterium]
MPKVLLIISGSIAAYKSLELIRLLRKEDVFVRVILTSGGAQFITPLSCAVLSGNPVFTDLFSLTEETEMGHIRLAREADMVVVAPATADLMAKAAQGRADDLASTVLLTTTSPLLMAPAMNVEMWHHPATQANLSLLKERGVSFIGPDAGGLACGEIGPGKMTDPILICTTIMEKLGGNHSLKGRRALVTAGPTCEPLDPVRYLSNASSGKQGYAIAAALLEKGAEVILITGPSGLPPPQGAHVVVVQTADEMWKATESHLPVDLAICTAAVADWRPEKISSQKIKKENVLSSLALAPNRDILASLATHKMRPGLLIGFAAETENVIENGKRKLSKCDWVIANDVSQGIFGADHTQVHFLTPNTCETWQPSGKKEVAKKLIERCAGALT